MNKEIILNHYLKIKPLEYKGFIVSEKTTYEMVGEVIGSAEPDSVIPLGAKVWFDSWMCKKFPVPGRENEFEWYVPISEIVKYEYDAPE